MLVDEALRRIANNLPKHVEGSRVTRNIPGRTKIGPVLDVFVSEDQGLMCIDIELSSPVQNTAWIRKSRGVTQLARQSSLDFLSLSGQDDAWGAVGCGVLRHRCSGSFLASPVALGRPQHGHVYAQGNRCASFLSGTSGLRGRPVGVSL